LITMVALFAALVLGAAAAPARYDVTLAGDTLQIEARVPPGSTVGVPDWSRPHVEAVAVESAPGTWRPLAGGENGWRLPAGVGHFRYQFRLGAAADALGDVDVAARCGAALVAPTSSWVLAPDSVSTYQLHVVTPPGITFASAYPPRGDVLLAPAPQHGPAPYAAFGPFSRETIAVGGGTLDFALARGLDADRAAVRAWTLTAARAVSAYFGRLPVPHALVLVVEKGRGAFGKQMGDGASSVLLQIAPGADLHDRAWDWVATHEMSHLGAPDLPRRHLWLEEGLATYVEPLARAMVGDMDVPTVWREMVNGMPQGQPAAGDRGLDHTRSWASTYWGGALFFLEADVEIRRATGGRRSLQSALQAVIAAGGDARTTWTIDRFLDTADHALDRPVLRPLYQQMALGRHEVDLERLWGALGVVRKGRELTFDDRAPEAAVRRGLTVPTAPDALRQPAQRN
jgi:hypothetical protein